MPLPLWPIISGGAGIIGNLVNSWFTGRANQQGKQYSQEMYERQRADALSDWNRNNAYNSPAAQMARFKEAGLNPNLIYGQSNTGQPVRSSSVENWKPNAPQIDTSFVAPSIMQYYDIQQKEAQTDNIQAATRIAIEDLNLRKVQTANAILGTEGIKTENAQKQFNLSLGEALRPATLEKAQQEVINLKAEEESKRANTMYTIEQNARASELNKANVAKIASEILTLETQRAKTEQEKANLQQAAELLTQQWFLNEYEINLNKEGIQKSDNAVMREAQRLLNKAKEQIKKQAQKIGPWKAPW